ncbi:sulfotransferase [Moumouvirus australiensis]|uniref:Sulfotransferase family protein n=1 Tax=Moumouvirus australiensis TaxID=2109587 RepID=A0A2P1ELS5_9VIRU|nr:sulfotransferase [Moumouvirus australiensis]AVL94847.1 sulfotransferase [Moumouvirus australiensis]
MFPLIDDNLKVIFFWSPKCACSSVKNYYISINKDKFKDKNISNVHAVVWCHPFTDLDKYKDYKKILIVRDPYERAVSAFITMMGYFGWTQYTDLSDEKFVEWFWENYNRKNEQFKIINDVNKSREQVIAYKKNPSFRNFLNILDSTDINFMNEHLSPQSYNYFFPKIEKNSFDSIVNIKDLNNWLKSFNKQHNIEGEIKNINQVPYNGLNDKMCDINIVEYFKKQIGYPNWIYFYDKEIKEKVEKIYASDFELTGKQIFTPLF